MLVNHEKFFKPAPADATDTSGHDITSRLKPTGLIALSRLKPTCAVRCGNLFPGGLMLQVQDLHLPLAISESLSRWEQ